MNYMSASLWAWEFLRRNPAYRSDWSRFSSYRGTSTDHSISLYQQKVSDQEAMKWGLMAYEHPDAETDRASLFWTIETMLEAEVVQNVEAPFLPMLDKSGAGVSGLQLLDGGLVLKLEREGNSVQIRLRDGLSFNEFSGIELRLPLNQRLPVRLSRSLDFWNIAVGEQVKKIAATAKQILASFLWSLTTFSPANPIAR